ncbi:MAG: hypothetical protein ABSH19_04350 [Opitutales bacterium]
MITLLAFKRLRLRGGCTIVQVEEVKHPLRDALGREATALTSIHGTRLSVLISAGLSPRDLSVTLYHEVLEAVAVASEDPPITVMEFNEGDFERAAQMMHDRLGEASPANLNRMLQLHGFPEK